MPADSRRVKELFVAALDVLDSQARQALLDRECGDDVELRQRVELLLAAHDQPHSALNQPIAAAPPDLTGAYPSQNATPTESVGSVIAEKYKLLQEIGEGGMGAVYMADQLHPVKRRVAVKVIKAGMDSARVLARFEAERQALALMDHPNIARVFDAGTTESNRPFFVMELVKGIPLTEFCDQHKLPMLDRLNLFVQICSAVQHAHQKGIIHRDLKPSNIIVESHDGKPVPKVIDFGLAKATTGVPLTEHTLFTALGQVAGTPLYMAPEQAAFNAIDVDTRADIYALGVILYELLTGTTPIERATFKKAAFDEMLRVIREQEPPTPSSRLSSSETKASVAAVRGMEPAKLGRFVKGELDWIVMKALSKERDRRYETANGFAKDVERFLNHEPVLAGPPSASYKLRKFVRRNRPQVIAAILILLALVSGIVGTTLGLIRAEKARSDEAEQRGIAEAKQKEAEEERSKADIERGRAIESRRKTLNALRAMTNSDVEKLIGAKKELGPNERAYLEAIAKRWQSFAAQDGTDEQSRALRAEGHFQVGLLWQRLGRREEARTEYEQARAIQDQLVSQFPAQPEFRVDLARTSHNLGNLFLELGAPNEARTKLERARDLMKELAEESVNAPEHNEMLAAIYLHLGVLCNRDGNREGAQIEYERARDLFKKLVEQHPKSADFQQGLARTNGNLGNVFNELRKPREALAAYGSARDLQKKLADRFPAEPIYRNELAKTHNSLGVLFGRLGKWDDSIAELKQAQDIQQKLIEQFPAVPDYQQDLAQTHNNMALAFSRRGNWPEARAQLERTRRIFDRLVLDFPTVLGYRVELADCRGALATVFREMLKWDEARVEFEQARDMQKALVAKHPNQPEVKNKMARTQYNFGALLLDMGRHEEACREFEQARDLQIALTREFPREPNYRQALATTHNGLGVALSDLGKRAEAAVEYEKSLSLKQSLADEFPDVPEIQVELGGSYCNYGHNVRNLGQPAESLQWYDKAIKVLAAVRAKEPRDFNAKQFLCNSYEGRAMAYDRLKKYADAVKDWDLTVELCPKPRQPVYRGQRANSRLRAGMIAEAIAEADEMTKLEGWSAKFLYDFACIYAVASAKIAERKQDYADRAMELLHRAKNQGFKDAAHMMKDTDLDPLRGREDFKKLLGELEGKPMKP